MDPSDLKALLGAVAKGKVMIPDAVARLRHLPFEDLGYARIDHHRRLRRGFPEVVYGEGKTVEQCAAIVGRVVKAGHPALVTRATRRQFERVLRDLPHAEWHEA